MKKLLALIIQFIAASVFLAANTKEITSMTSTAACDICDLNLIYGSEYSYSLPKKVLEGFLSGKAFDHKEPYTAEESLEIHQDINRMFQKMLSSDPVKKPFAVITAGAPGAGKTMKLRQDLERSKLFDGDWAYVCPDDVCLKDLTGYLRDGGIGKAAYDKWRPASNAAAHLLLANLIREKYAFYFGTTSSGAGTANFFDFLKKQGYQIRLIHVCAPDDIRWESIRERDKTFVQTTEQDVKEKGLLLPQRIMDTFLKYADSIEFCYRGGLKEDAQLAARWTRNAAGATALGTLHVTDFARYEQIKAVHNAAAKTLNRPELAWESTVEANSEVIIGR